MMAILLAVVLWLFVIVVVLALVSMTRPELPLHQCADDDEQRRAVTRPAALGQHPQQGYQPAHNVIPWGRRVQNPPREP